jgi:steroid 5-alpha reductase family enzyme
VSGPALLAAAAAALAVSFAIGYALARRLNNYGIVDILWSYAFAAVAILFAAGGPGWWVRRALLAAAVAVWSVRLGTHLLVRIAHHHPTEDGRYQRLREEWADGFAWRMGGFFQLQAASVLFLALPFFWICRNPAASLRPLEWVGLAVWTLAIAGEALADAQLAGFKRRVRAGAESAVCDVGLWRYSRHPNYFCEWLIWVGYAVWACASPWGWLGLLSPASILFLLLRVTGIPMTEAQSVRSKGDAYRRYQARTSAFVPWFPRA